MQIWPHPLNWDLGSSLYYFFSSNFLPIWNSKSQKEMPRLISTDHTLTDFSAQMINLFLSFFNLTQPILYFSKMAIVLWSLTLSQLQFFSVSSILLILKRQIQSEEELCKVPCAGVTSYTSNVWKKQNWPVSTTKTKLTSINHKNPEQKTTVLLANNSAQQGICLVDGFKPRIQNMWTEV